MDFLPLFHNLKGRNVLLVGGGEVALRKGRLLADAGAALKVVAPEIDPQLTELALHSQGSVQLRGYQADDLQDICLVIAATDDEPLNAQISVQAQALGVPVNVVDAPKLCSVIFPAIVDRSPLIIAVTSGGDAPVLARLIENFRSLAHSLAELPMLARTHGLALEFNSQRSPGRKVVGFPLAPPEAPAEPAPGPWSRWLARLGIASQHALQAERVQRQHMETWVRQLWDVNQTWAWDDNVVLRFRKT